MRDLLDDTVAIVAEKRCTSSMTRKQLGPELTEVGPDCSLPSLKHRGYKESGLAPARFEFAYGSLRDLSSLMEVCAI
eukprot:1188850-Prorocentrum_minimum.AAC.1